MLVFVLKLAKPPLFGVRINIIEIKNIFSMTQNNFNIFSTHSLFVKTS